MTENPPPPTSDDRLLSALAHLFGILVALIIWATHKDKSPSVRFQAVQAIAFDIVVMVFIMLFTFACSGSCLPGCLPACLPYRLPNRPALQPGLS